ncbi:MAG: MerR family transcriptional regulator, redox-sensitive transcriptional activator SoxR [Solirubrobacterales bacterium]|jgi:MerR family redox-sensitive transcriptional activator SoxR|nr:MerR family transcriptional regulator, redox-sensitive transcriptional activator SoxR [Solirubrobacterales bacterium]
MASESLSIGQVAAQAGIRTSSIRYYESVGVLPEADRVSGQRRYSPEILTRLGFIDIAQQAGFSLDEIRELLDGSMQEQASDRLQDLARRKLPDIEELISRAEAMKGWLQAAGDCQCPSLDLCVLFSDAAHSSLPSKTETQRGVISSNAS